MEGIALWSTPELLLMSLLAQKDPELKTWAWK